MYYQTNSTNNDTFFKQHNSTLNIHVIYKCMTSQHKIVYNINKSYTQKILQQVIQKTTKVKQHKKTPYNKTTDEDENQKVKNTFSTLTKHTIYRK